MDALKSGRHPEEPTDLPFGELNATVAVIGGPLRRRRRQHGFPGWGNPVGRILREQAVEERGARPGKSHDGERAPDHFTGDLRIPLAVGLDSKPVAQDARGIAAGGEASDKIEGPPPVRTSPAGHAAQAGNHPRRNPRPVRRRAASMSSSGLRVMKRLTAGPTTVRPG